MLIEYAYNGQQSTARKTTQALKTCTMNEDAVLYASVLYSEQEVLAEFQESCEAEAETPGQCKERLKLATEDLCQMLEGQNRNVKRFR